MQMKHLLIEGYCDGETGKDVFPCENTLRMGAYCFTCPKFSYTICPNEIAVSDNNGLIDCADCSIGFGGDMEPDDSQKRETYISMWRTICKEKITEAYNEYLKHIPVQG